MIDVQHICSSLITGRAQQQHHPLFRLLPNLSYILTNLTVKTLAVADLT